MKFYIASSFANKEAVRALASRLIREGFTQTYDWTKNERAATLEDLSRIGEEEKAAVMSADFFVLLLPGGKGSHVELGIALGLGKRVYIYSPDSEVNDLTATPTFYYVTKVERFTGSFDEFVEKLISHEKVKREDIYEN
ncbi:nucleoside 2-deoxyribosyltransferase [Thermaerobacillus caldiproteolyticus]|uniref:nucleoside 2-deoxyribosyltransferase n=1 Tax=Thermaerobacillus caldiproteolyticus TaxID=247480 RepID=UPI0018F1F577|nr:nucleoside 2-deoxyribosyltransferase [Anoxybacillus caldiproteolyticus]